MIVVHGATGYTGSLVAQKLVSSGLPLALAGRDRARVTALAGELGVTDIRVAAVHDGAALRQAFAGASLVVNCAGPFSEIGEPVMAAAIDTGCHYIDTAAEQAFMRDMYERYESRARGAQVTAINALAFEVALGDWASALAASHFEPPVDDISVAYAVRGTRPTTGTLRSMLDAAGRPNCRWVGDRWEPVAHGKDLKVFTFPAPFGVVETLSFPSGEVITVPRHIETRSVQTFVSAVDDPSLAQLVNRATSLAGPFIPLLAGSAVGAFLRSRLDAGRRNPTEAERGTWQWSIVARAEKSFARKQVTVTGRDPYRVTAEITAYCARRLLEAPAPRGVITPAQAFPADECLEDIAHLCDLKVERSP